VLKIQKRGTNLVESKKVVPGYAWLKQDMWGGRRVRPKSRPAEVAVFGVVQERGGAPLHIGNWRGREGKGTGWYWGPERDTDQQSKTTLGSRGGERQLGEGGQHAGDSRLVGNKGSKAWGAHVTQKRRGRSNGFQWGKEVCREDRFYYTIVGQLIWGRRTIDTARVFSQKIGKEDAR